MNKLLLLVIIGLITMLAVLKIHYCHEIEKLNQHHQLQLEELRKSYSLACEEKKLSSYLSSFKVVTAPQLAKALMTVAPQYRATLAAMAIKESHGNPRALGTLGEKGIFQVREKYWGKVPTTILGQVQQAEEIVATLHEEHYNSRTAIAAYNGSGPKALSYADSVIALRKKL